MIEDKKTSAPSLQKTKQLWEGKAKEIHNWRSEAGLGSKKVFTGEVEFQARGNGMNWRRPFDFLDKSPINKDEQNTMHEVYLSVMCAQDKSWLDGVFLCLGEDQPNPPVRQTVNYSQQNRPAEKTMSKYYEGTKTLPMKASVVNQKSATTDKTASTPNFTNLTNKVNGGFKDWVNLSSARANSFFAPGNFNGFQKKK